LKVSVEDNGYGISLADQAKLFKLMESIKNDKNMNKKGIGLGLCICKIITNEFDGEISV
jgi:K+-sensing histidine kinase KdpD